MTEVTVLDALIKKLTAKNLTEHEAYDVLEYLCERRLFLEPAIECKLADYYGMDKQMLNCFDDYLFEHLTSELTGEIGG